MRCSPRRVYRPYPFGWQYRGCGNPELTGSPEGVDVAKKKTEPKDETQVVKDSAEVKGHTNLQPYPTDLNEPCNLLLQKLNGQEVDINCCIHAAYQVAGVALGHLFPDEHDHAPVASSMATVNAPSDEEAKGLLEQATVKTGPLTDMLLQQLLAFALKKLQEWLASR